MWRENCPPRRGNNQNKTMIAINFLAVSNVLHSAATTTPPVGVHFWHRGKKNLDLPTGKKFIKNSFYFCIFVSWNWPGYSFIISKMDLTLDRKIDENPEETDSQDEEPLADKIPSAPVENIPTVGPPRSPLPPDSPLLRSRTASPALQRARWEMEMMRISCFHFFHWYL